MHSVLLYKVSCKRENTCMLILTQGSYSKGVKADNGILQKQSIRL